ncbi:head fiber protein [Acidomonas methanolica]|uniref:Head fiber protein n=1 Tax=Acidomonas methanolica NBRC 104435 TaxID=1231351 RepID=A0A023D7Q3_ACIMT|nr:head fiber protein [Acidomonas methanolica]TCS24098.1 head fiber protein [Acidomonas methanolica]GAJ29750.1 hypothetical protein Amme_076_043 [Acidomonas methanolica NBRC 104435]GBQ59377.1 hypothetical protein AA0498_2739 [Acidomonas methanolica]GEL00013.1 hypothetical protein AME01nite_25110 [Acidomonas methanolica NBRC 104435]
MSINQGAFEGGPCLTKREYVSDQSTKVTGVATQTQAGGVKQIAHIAALTAAPTETDFNGLLTALQTAGIMAAS